MRKLDLVGRRFGRLVVVRPAPNLFYKDRPRTAWWCVCDCGKEKKVGTDPLRSGRTESCGCLFEEQSIGVRTTTHGHKKGRSRTREYRAWLGMKERCYKQGCERYYCYGGRGISVCSRWRDSFEAFFSDMGNCPVGKSLDRINNDGNYEPGNCRWASTRQQAANTSLNVHVVLDGKRMILKRAAERLGIPYKWLHFQIRYSGLSLEESIARRKKIDEVAA